MPAGYTNPESKPPRANNAREFARESVYLPKSALDLADFMIRWGDLPELEPYQTMPEAQQSIAEDIAEKLFTPGVDADRLVELYLATQEAETNPTPPEATPTTNEPLPTVYVVTQYPVESPQPEQQFRIPA